MEEEKEVGLDEVVLVRPGFSQWRIGLFVSFSHRTADAAHQHGQEKVMRLLTSLVQTALQVCLYLTGDGWMGGWSSQPDRQRREVEIMSCLGLLSVRRSESLLLVPAASTHNQSGAVGPTAVRGAHPPYARRGPRPQVRVRVL